MRVEEPPPRGPGNPAGDAAQGVPRSLVRSRKKWFDSAFQRGIDLVIGTFLLLVSLIVVLPACLAIWLDSPGPVLYRQWRSGRDGHPFRIFKLRTMVDDADRCGPPLTQHADPRITRIGSVLRRWSIDELPQLLNVLAGDMSLVGPRPEVVTIVKGYTSRQRGVLQARPGLTGWAAVNGRDDLSIEEKLERELEYVMNRSIRKDLPIMLRTVKVVLSGRGIKR